MSQKYLVKFNCCNTERIYVSDGEFHMCECGKSGFDKGNAGYCRRLGSPDNLEIIPIMCDADVATVTKYNLFKFKTLEDNTCFILDSKYYVEMRDGINFFLYSNEGFIGKFSRMKHAMKRWKKEETAPLKERSLSRQYLKAAGLGFSYGSISV